MLNSAEDRFAMRKIWDEAIPPKEEGRFLRPGAGIGGSQKNGGLPIYCDCERQITEWNSLQLCELAGKAAHPSNRNRHRLEPAHETGDQRTKVEKPEQPMVDSSHFHSEGISRNSAQSRRRFAGSFYQFPGPVFRPVRESALPHQTKRSLVCRSAAFRRKPGNSRSVFLSSEIRKIRRSRNLFCSQSGRKRYSSGSQKAGALESLRFPNPNQSSLGEQ